MNLFTPITRLTPTETQELIYPYSGPPPMAYGSHTRLVLENLARPYKYYSVPINTAIKTTNSTLEELNYDGPCSKFDPKMLDELTIRAFEANSAGIREAMNNYPKLLFQTKFADLAKGRQTYSFIQNRNIPAAQALEETMRFIETNLGRKIGTTMADYLVACTELMELDNVTVTTSQYSREDGEMKKRTKTQTWSADELYDKIVIINTMAKNAERGKLNRRSIATTNMIVRGFVTFAESMASEVLKILRSSGIPIGGQEKLAKLVSVLSSVEKKDTSGELSGDITKWNECLDPDAMRRVIDILASKSDLPSWVRELLQVAFLLFKSKAADLGKGISVSNEFGHTQWVLFEDPLFPEDAEEYLFLNDLKHGENSVKCRLGMFMGMFNFSSTLLALMAIEGTGKSDKHVQSSDDFIHFFDGRNEKEICSIEAPCLYVLFKSLGINMSEKKCVLICDKGIGEYNSKFHHNDFVGNVGTELPGITPPGFNMASDLTMSLRVIKTSLATHEMLLPTAALALRILLKAYRHAYRVEGETKRTKYIGEKLQGIEPLICQGGKNCFSISSIHLDEIALRSVMDDIAPDYLRRIMNPENPFSGGSAMLTIKSESKRPHIEEDSSVGSIFKFSQVRNRTILNSPHVSDLEVEKMYKEITKAVETIMPETLLGVVGSSCSIQKALETRLECMISGSGLSVAEQAELIERMKQPIDAENSDEDSD
uniref:RNA-directed RNA polymerase catalytic subunit n=1 Tax=Soybean thrips thogotovirus 1 TaxID=2797871 RepID=A0A7T8ARA0_9ORTO|nr:RNA-dependent RNA polymerase subunit PB1 [Soybean thrips thogotovirus 1]